MPTFTELLRSCLIRYNEFFNYNKKNSDYFTSEKHFRDSMYIESEILYLRERQVTPLKNRLHEFIHTHTHTHTHTHIHTYIHTHTCSNSSTNTGRISQTKFSNQQSFFTLCLFISYKIIRLSMSNMKSQISLFGSYEC
jgi:hypothetical protein